MYLCIMIDSVLGGEMFVLLKMLKRVVNADHVIILLINDLRMFWV